RGDLLLGNFGTLLGSTGVTTHLFLQFRMDCLQRADFLGVIVYLQFAILYLVISICENLILALHALLQLLNCHGKIFLTSLMSKILSFDSLLCLFELSFEDQNLRLEVFDETLGLA